MTAATRNKQRRPLTPWELPTLLQPVHQHRRSKSSHAVERAHYPAILSFVYRNRYSVASQIQRRFHNILTSDRTTRRHLSEMEALGYIDVVTTRSVSPLWPKVYFVTKRGAQRLRQELAARGKPGHVIRVDRSRGEGYSAEHVVHEILATEFLLAVWQTIEARGDIELLQTERRSLGGNPAFKVGVNGTATAVEPDAMFVYRKRERGAMCCFVELDNGTMSTRQMQAKFRRYEAWLNSSHGQHFLIEVYKQYGAKEPRPVCRILLVANTEGEKANESRLPDLLAASVRHEEVRQRLWITTTTDLRHEQFSDAPLGNVPWYLAHDAFGEIAEQPKIHGAIRGGLRKEVAQALSESETRRLFGAH
jgi:hypothetical protein